MVAIPGGLDGSMRIEKACVSSCPLVSATRTVNGKVPVAVAVPEIAPVVAFRLKPGGSVPVPGTMLKVSAPKPPTV